MSETATATVTPSAPPPSASEPSDKHEIHDWHRPKEPEKASPEPRVEARKEKPTPEKAAPSKSAAKPEVDEDPEEEWEDGKGGKLKAKRSAIREAFARKAEIERASHEKFQKAAESRKLAEEKERQFVEVVNGLEKDPWAIHRYKLMQRGASESEANEKINALAEARLVAQMRRAQMTPEQIEIEAIKEENARFKESETTRLEEEKTKRHTELKAKHKENWDKQIGEAMVDAKLPKTRATAARVARVLADHMDPQTGKSIEPQLAARIARDQHHTEIRGELTELLASNPQAAIELLGPKLVKAIIEQQAAAHREFVPQGAPPSIPKPKPTPQRQGPPTLEDARKSLGIRRF